MEQPSGFFAQEEIGKVCRLWKSLHDLKHSPRAWFGKFSQTDETFDKQKSKSDHSVFYKNSSSGIILLVVYVDDIVITGVTLVESKTNELEECIPLYFSLIHCEYIYTKANLTFLIDYNSICKVDICYNIPPQVGA